MSRIVKASLLVLRTVSVSAASSLSDFESAPHSSKRPLGSSFLDGRVVKEPWVAVLEGWPAGEHLAPTWAPSTLLPTNSLVLGKTLSSTGHQNRVPGPAVPHLVRTQTSGSASSHEDPVASSRVFSPRSYVSPRATVRNLEDPPPGPSRQKLARVDYALKLRVAKIYLTNSMEYMNSAVASRKMRAGIWEGENELIETLLQNYEAVKDVHAKRTIHKDRRLAVTPSADWTMLTSKRIILHPKFLAKPKKVNHFFPFGMPFGQGVLGLPAVASAGHELPAFETILDSRNPTSNNHDFTAAEDILVPYEKLLILVDKDSGSELSLFAQEKSGGTGLRTGTHLQPALGGEPVELWEEIMGPRELSFSTSFPIFTASEQFHKEKLPWSPEQGSYTSPLEGRLNTTGGPKTHTAYIVNERDSFAEIRFVTQAIIDWSDRSVAPQFVAPLKPRRPSVHVYALRMVATHDAWSVVNKRSYVWPEDAELAPTSTNILTLVI